MTLYLVITGVWLIMLTVCMLMVQLLILPNPEFVFFSCGEKLVTLTMNDSTDCQIIDSTLITVFDLPTPLLSSPPCRMNFSVVEIH